MQLSTERRSPQLTRVPLDDVLIDLSPEGTDESFAADGVNVGLGGLSMRASILPDVGSKLRCRFESPHDGESVDADCEVVWAEANGPNVGEFGMRFTGITDRDQSCIEALVNAWSADLMGDAPRHVELALDGVGSAIDGEVVHDSVDAMVVEQPLPFLRLGIGVGEGDRRGKLQGVDLRFEDELPRLVLTIQFEDEAPLDVSLPDLEPSTDTAFAGAESGDDTLMDGAAPRMPETFERPRFPSVRPNEGPSVPPREEAQELRYEGDEEAKPLEAADLKPSLLAALHRVSAWMGPFIVKLRPLLAALIARSGPGLRSVGMRLRRFAGLLSERTRQAFSRVRGRMTRRRKTAAPRPAGQGRSRRGRIRMALAIVALAALAYIALGSDSSDLQKTEQQNAAIPSPTPEPVDPEMGDDSAPAEPEVRPEVAPGETPATSPYARETTNEAAPSAATVESGSIENGRSYTLRMSLPPRGMRGQDMEDGIRVVILGSNAIDTARRIARADPRVASAAILNHGEEAELRLRFTDGERPGYRVESRSSRLVITIGD